MIQTSWFTRVKGYAQLPVVFPCRALVNTMRYARMRHSCALCRSWARRVVFCDENRLPPKQETQHGSEAGAPWQDETLPMLALRVSWTHSLLHFEFSTTHLLRRTNDKKKSAYLSRTCCIDSRYTSKPALRERKTSCRHFFSQNTEFYLKKALVFSVVTTSDH